MLKKIDGVYLAIKLLIYFVFKAFKKAFEDFWFKVVRKHEKVVLVLLITIMTVAFIAEYIV